MKQLRRGFTLIELLVVVAIIGLLSSVVLVAINSARYRARFSRVRADLKQITLAAQLDFDSNGNWAPDGWPGQPTRFVPGYLARWPSPPCPGWTYDWENWDGGGNTYTRRTTVRRTSQGGSGANGVYYLCIDSSNSTCDAGGPVGGSDITAVTNGQITCNE